MLKRSDCCLRPLEERDLQQILEWRNSERIRKVMFNDKPIEWKEHTAWYQRVKANETNSRHFIFIYSGRSLGQVNLTQVDLLNQRCYWGFFIGPDNAPRGSGMAMGYLALEQVFDVMKLHKICSEVLSFNKTSIHYHRKLGFIEEGQLKEHLRKDGKRIDIDCLAHFTYLWQQQKKSLYRRCFEENDSERN